MFGVLVAGQVSRGCTPLDKQTDRSFGSISLGCGESCIPPGGSGATDVSDTYSVTRVVGPGTPGFLNNDGSLSNPDQAVANGVVGPEACMTAHIGLYPGGTVSASLILNGTTVGSWSYTAPPPQYGGYELYTIIHVPIRLIKFATKSTTPGAAPTPGINEVTLRTYLGECALCGVGVDLGPLTFDAMAPIILVHGTGSNPKWFAQSNAPSTGACGGGTGYNFVGLFEYDGLPVVCSEAAMPDRYASFRSGARDLKGILATVSTEYGANHFHILAHSNGGNWARTMMATLADEDKYGIYSLITLSTPFSGTVLADIAAAGGASWRYRFRNVNFFVGWLKGNNDLVRDSQTAFASQWNLHQRHPLEMTVNFVQQDGSTYSDGPTPVSYYSLAANADRNGNGVIDGTEGQDVSNLLSQLTANMRYQLLAHTDSLTVCSVDPATGRCQPGTLFASPNYTRTQASRPNDTVVTVFSGQWPDPLYASSAEMSDQQFTLVPGDGGPYWLFNHKTLGNPTVAAAVLAAIRQAQPIQ